jgi:hypothetical protein
MVEGERKKTVDDMGVPTRGRTTGARARQRTTDIARPRVMSFRLRISLVVDYGTCCGTW